MEGSINRILYLSMITKLIYIYTHIIIVCLNDTSNIRRKHMNKILIVF